jgi:hypothetical protein
MWLLSEGDRKYFFKDVVDAQGTFEVDAAGSVTAAIWHQFGLGQRGDRIP